MNQKNRLMGFSIDEQSFEDIKSKDSPLYDARTALETLMRGECSEKLDDIIKSHEQELAILNIQSIQALIKMSISWDNDEFQDE